VIFRLGITESARNDIVRNGVEPRQPSRSAASVQARLRSTTSARGRSESRPPTRKFHIIQPVVVNQNSRSPACASRWRRSFFRCSSRIPPWPWTIAFGSPVVPEL